MRAISTPGGVDGGGGLGAARALGSVTSAAEMRLLPVEGGAVAPPGTNKLAADEVPASAFAAAGRFFSSRMPRALGLSGFFDGSVERFPRRVMSGDDDDDRRQRRRRGSSPASKNKAPPPPNGPCPATSSPQKSPPSAAKTLGVGTSLLCFRGSAFSALSERICKTPSWKCDRRECTLGRNGRDSLSLQPTPEQGASAPTLPHTGASRS